LNVASPITRDDDGVVLRDGVGVDAKGLERPDLSITPQSVPLRLDRDVVVVVGIVAGGVPPMME